MPTIEITERLKARFWAKVKKTKTCWLWQGATNNHGYGLIKQPLRSNQLLAHRVSYVIHFGPLPEGVCALHRCDNPPCVNPDHLFDGTKKDNTQDMISKGRNCCPKGEQHPKAKLTTEDVIQIRAFYPKRRYGDVRRMAAIFGVTTRQIHLVATGANWKDANAIL